MISQDNAGGAIVRQGFNLNGRYLKRGETLTAAEVASIGLPNYRALVNAGHMDVFPKSPDYEKHVYFKIGKGGGKVEIIYGYKVTNEPIPLEDADDVIEKHRALS